MNWIKNKCVVIKNWCKEKWLAIKVWFSGVGF